MSCNIWPSARSSWKLHFCVQSQTQQCTKPRYTNLNKCVTSLHLLENLPLWLIGLSSPHHSWPSSSSQSHRAFKSPFWSPSISKLPTIIPLSDAYNTCLCRLAFLASHHLGFPSEALKEGTYAWVSKHSLWDACRRLIFTSGQCWYCWDEHCPWWREQRWRG